MAEFTRKGGITKFADWETSSTHELDCITRTKRRARERGERRIRRVRRAGWALFWIYIGVFISYVGIRVFEALMRGAWR